MQEKHDKKKNSIITVMAMWECISDFRMYILVPFVVLYIISHMDLETPLDRAVAVSAIAYLTYLAIQGLIFSFVVKSSYKQHKQNHD